MRNPFLLAFILLLSSCGQKPGGDGHDTLKPDSTQAVNAGADCDVLKKRVPKEEKQDEIKNDLARLHRCSIDSFDYVYVVPNLFPAWANEMHVQGNDTVTYNDFMKHLDEFKHTDSYVTLHTQVETLDSLKSIAYDPSKLETMKPVLGKLGFTEEEWDNFERFAHSYPVPRQGIFTWGDMLDAFDKHNSASPQ